MRALLALMLLSTTVAAACDPGSDPSPPAAETESPAPAAAETPVVRGNSAGGSGMLRPPAAYASASGSTALVQLGIGTFCWGEPGQGGICVDMVGPITGPQALPVMRGATVSVTNPVTGAAIQTANLRAWASPTLATTTSTGERVWNIPPAGGAQVPATVDATGVRFVADFAPGTYVVGIGLFYGGRDVSYGLLLDVR